MRFARVVVAVVAVVVAVAGMVVSGGAASAADRSGAALSWHAPQLTDPARGFTSVSCVAHDLCRAGTTPDLVKRWDGQHWQDGDTFPAGTAGILSMSCPSRAFCGAVQLVAVDGAYEYRPITRRADGTWNLTSPLVPAGRVQPYFRGSLSCTSAGFCLLVNGSEQFQRWDGSSWTAPVAFGEGSGSGYVSCVTTTLCRTVDRTGKLYTWRGSVWSGPRDVKASAAGLDCPTTSFCMILTAAAGYVVLDGSSMSAPTRFDRSGYPTGLSCTDRNFCIAVDNASNSFGWDGTSWSGPHRQVSPPAYEQAVSCSSPGFCAAVSSEGYAAERVTGTWRPAQLVQVPAGGVQNVSCADPQLCVLVDSEGNASAFTGSSWTTPQRRSSGYLFHVSCAPDASFCAAEDHNGAILYRRHGQWSAPSYPTVHPGTGFVVGCGSPTFCMVVTGLNSVRTWNGSSWRTVGSVPYGEGAGFDLSCQPGGCVISGANGDHTSQDQTYVYRVGDPELTYAGNSQGVSSFSCLSVTDCIGQGDDDSGLHTYRFDGSLWNLLPGDPPGDYPTHSLSCVSDDYCAAAYGRSVSRWNGSHWSALQPILGSAVPSDVDLRSISCRPGICAAVTYEGWTILAT